LRAKLRPHEEFLHTVHGEGYLFRTAANPGKQ
jgi:DNA-binding response OmpR family regulator